MQPVRIPVLRAALLVAAIAALAIFLGRGTAPALATSFNPQNSVSVSDPSPGAHADLRVNFTLEAPEAFPNVTDSPAVQFLPKEWGISTDAPLGAVGGKFEALSTLGILGFTPCIFSINFNPDMYVASVDPGNPTSALDLEGHPGGPGYSGQFVPDPDDPDGKYGGITRYPDFLADMFPPEEIGPPLVRLWGGQNVLLAAISLNIVTFAPGQLPGYPASLGYPTVIVLLDPVAPVDLLTLTVTSDLCSPLNLVNTNFGVSKDNPSTAADESGHPLLTNPHSQKEHVFTLIATAQPDADDDGIENWLDTCAFAPNTEDVDGRHDDGDGDGLDGACDPDPTSPSPPDPSGLGVSDEDGDNYANRADLCPTVPNGIGIDLDSVQLLQVGEFVFFFAEYTDLVGSDNQADTDGDRIGDACEGAEAGAQCANSDDDDADGLVNDGCPSQPPSSTTPESGDQCANDLDDDGDGAVNDGCPSANNAETGAQCANDLDDDGDGKVNEGCPSANNAETGAQCANDLDDDGDGKVNEGCPSVNNAETGDECLNDLDDDGDGKVNEGCPNFPTPNGESGAQCGNGVDDDSDGVIDDGCPQFPSPANESGAQCNNALDDDFDGVVNDGCPGYPAPTEPAPDLGTPLVDFAANEQHTFVFYWEPPYNQRTYAGVYRDNDNDGTISPGDDRVIDLTPPPDRPDLPNLACGTVQAGDWDDDEGFIGQYGATGLYPWINNEGHTDPDNNGQMSCNEPIYADADDSGDVSNGDVRAFLYQGSWATVVGAPVIESETGDQCANDTDDNGNGLVNEGCPTVSNAETGAECANNLDDDGDGVINDGCPTVSNAESGAQCDNATDDDGDGRVNEGCPNFPTPNNESGAQCDNATDDDFDGVVNDGCPSFPTPNNESGAQCDNATDDDFDGVVNDGCPNFPTPNNESGAQCDNATDDDFDGKVNDGCPTVALIGAPETGAQCENNVDDDGDGFVNDGCPAIDPGDAAKNTVTGHVHVVTIENSVLIFKHGIKLNALGGPPKLNNPGARTYHVDVSNISATDPEDIQVALRVVEGCATVNGNAGQDTAVVSVGPGGSGTASFTVDWTGCAAGEYTVQADACHAGDAAPAGFFGVGACPGVSDGKVDPNPLDDAPRSKTVDVGSP